MNILIIDDLLLPEETKAVSSKKALFYRAAAENSRRRFFLAKEFSKKGANVLLARLRLCFSEAPLSFEYSEECRISVLTVRISAKQSGRFLRLPELFSFSSALSENSPSLSGLFRPDAVIAGGLLPFSVSAGAKIAEGSNAVLITELCCFPKEVFKNLGLCSPLDPVLAFLKKSTFASFEKSYAVLGLFPLAAQKFSGAHNLYPMVLPSPVSGDKPSESALEKAEMLSSFREGKTFVLAFPGELEEGYSIEELILSAGTFGDKFALVFLSEGRKKPFFKRFVAEKGITNVFFAEGISKSDLPFVLSEADGVFVSESDFGKGVFPEEEGFFRAFLSGRPVIASSEHHADFFRKSGGTIITKPRRRDSITLGIKTLMSMTENDRETLGRSNREFAEKNSPEKFADECFSLFDNLVKQKEIKK